jgi:hypothetical protein
MVRVGYVAESVVRVGYVAACVPSRVSVTIGDVSTTTPRTGTTPVVVFDLAMLRFEWTGARTGMTVWTPARRLLAAWEAPEGEQVSEREAVFQALDRVLELPLLLDGTEHQVALYNPYTSQIALSPVPDTLTFTDGDPVELVAEGSIAALVQDALAIGGRRLARLDVDFASVSAALTAHRD